jgi:hypothetical protein
MNVYMRAVIEMLLYPKEVFKKLTVVGQIEGTEYTYAPVKGDLYL